MAGPLVFLVMCLSLETARAHRFTTPSDPSSLHSKVAMLENHYEELQKKFRIQTNVFEAQNHKLKSQLRSQGGKLRDLQDRNDRLEKEQQQMLKTFSDLSATLFRSKWSGQSAVQEILTTTPLIPKASGYGWSLDHIIQNQTRKIDQLETENKMLRDVVFRLQEKGSSMEAMLIENSALIAQLHVSDQPGFQKDPSRRDVSVGSLGKLVASQSDEIRTLRRIFHHANDTLSLQRRRLTSLGDLFQGQGMVISKQASVLESLRKTTKELEAVVDKQGAEVGQTQREMEETKRNMGIMDRQVRELDLKHSMVTTQLGWKYNQLKNMVPGGENLPPLTIEKPQRTNSLLSPSTAFSTSDNEVSTHDMQDLASHLQDHIKDTRLLPEKVSNLDRTVRGHNIFITEFQRRETEVYKMLAEHEKIISQVMQATDAIQQYIAMYMNSQAIGPELRLEWEDRYSLLTSAVTSVTNELKDLKAAVEPKMDKVRGIPAVQRSVDDMEYKVTDLEDKVRNIQYTLATLPRH
ncbi:putative leucine-rich repeat-containing protein DDB_G0290503 [Branchiostoma lanceolatum]|uniref:putative leucine-rich repeat-containing protein DDB_G0290503 n=1 Tax=Branchiostoma lanceolatum TaxID=7740 RepID=UPI003457066F